MSVEARGSRRDRPAALAFYEAAVAEAERPTFEAAFEVDGLDGEIALLRTRLLQLAAQGEAGNHLLMKGIELLVRAVGARYRLGKQDQDALLKAVEAMVLKGDETAGRSQT